LRIATDWLDVPTEIIAPIDQYRWSIKLFFRFWITDAKSAIRWFKQLGVR
jgi:hypothetical protein